MDVPIACFNSSRQFSGYRYSDLPKKSPSVTERILSRCSPDEKNKAQSILDPSKEDGWKAADLNYVRFSERATLSRTALQGNKL